ncbi:MAG: hypothetical protein ACYSRQ_04275 [Planctomycetota bacterium]|jgi:hypothetical protein
MNNLLLKLLLVSGILSLSAAGCDSLKFPAARSETLEQPSDSLSMLARYAPVKVSIMPLTKFEKAGQSQQTQIHVYVSLLDSFGSQIKSPSTFRFELYDKIELSTQPKGSRIVIWPDMDLTNPKDNNKYWSDFFRAYEFRLGFEPKENKSYILQVTSIDHAKKRLSTEITIDTP